MKELKFSEISRIIRKHDYILLRDTWGHLTGINCKVALLSEKRSEFNPRGKSGFYSFIPCTIMEYINCKNGYL